MHDWTQLADRVLALIASSLFAAGSWLWLRYVGRNDALAKEAKEARDTEIKKHADEISKLKSANTRLGNRICHCEWLLKIEPPVE